MLVVRNFNMRSACGSIALEHSLLYYQKELLQHRLRFAADEAADSVVRDFRPVHLLSRDLDTDTSFSIQADPAARSHSRAVPSADFGRSFRSTPDMPHSVLADIPLPLC